MPIMNIKTVQIETGLGNTLQLFYNSDTGLVVVDLIAANEKGGSEILHRHIDEGTMLAHTQSKSRKVLTKVLQTV